MEDARGKRLEFSACWKARGFSHSILHSSGLFSEFHCDNILLSCLMQRSPNPAISYIWAVHGTAALVVWPWTTHGALNCPIFCNCSEFSLISFPLAAPPFSANPTATCLEPIASLGSHTDISLKNYLWYQD